MVTRRERENGTSASQNAAAAVRGAIDQTTCRSGENPRDAERQQEKQRLFERVRQKRESGSRSGWSETGNCRKKFCGRIAIEVLMIPAKAKRKNVDRDHCAEKNHQKIFSCRRPKNLIIFVCAHAFPTATVDNFVDYWPRCRRDQPGMRVPANRLTMRQKNSFDIGRFHKFKNSWNWDGSAYKKKNRK